MTVHCTRPVPHRPHPLCRARPPRLTRGCDLKQPRNIAGRLRLLTGVVLACAVVSLVSCSREAKKTRALDRAEKYFKAGQFDNAKVEFLNALRLDSNNEVCYARLGAIWLDEGAPLRAAPFLLKAKELAPDDLENRLKLARVFSGLGARKEGFTEATYTLDHSPNDTGALLLAAESARTEQERNRVDAAIAGMNQNDASVQLGRAAAAISRGDREGASKSVQVALNLDPKLAHAHVLMATLWLLQRQPVKAGEEFKTAADLSPPRSSARLRYAQFQMQSGATDQAWNTLASMTKAAPDFLPAWLQLAEISLGRKKYDESLKLLANIFNRDPDNIEAHVLEARVLLAEGENEKAAQGLERIAKQYPNFPAIKCELARAYLQANNAPQAVNVLKEALVANPEYVDAAVLLAQVNLRTGNATAVVEAMVPFTERHPEVNAARLLLADAYRVLGRLDEAANVFREQLKTSPDNAEASLALGIILRQQKKNDEAREMLLRTQQLAPANPIALMQLVEMDVASGDFARAEKLVSEQLQKTPDSALAYFLQGRIAAAQSKWDAAEVSLNQALKLNPNFSNAYGLLATVYTASNKLPEAVRQLETIVTRTPNDARAAMSLAVLYERLRDYDKARDAYEKVIAISPDFAPALNNLAFLCAEFLNQQDRAYQLAEKARGLQPGDGAIADTLGWVSFKKRDYAQALTLLTEAAGKMPNDPEIQYHLGMCQYMVGSTNAARDAFEQALKSPSDFPDKADAQRRLALVSADRSDRQLGVADVEAIVRQNPDDVLARMRLADAYVAAKSFKQAAAEYEEVLKLNPKLAPALLKAAEVYSDALNDPTKALEYAKSARQLLPGDAKSTLLLGRIAFKTGNYPWAYGLLKQSSDDLPNDPGCHHALAWSAFTMGNIPEAMEQMEQVTRLAPDTSFASDANTWLAMMRLASNPAAPDAHNKIADVLRTDPNYAPAQFAQVALAAHEGDMNRAVAGYEELLNRFPDFAPAQRALALVYATRPDSVDKAYDLAMKARKTLPEDPEVAEVLADVSYQRREYARALQLLEESARKKPLDANHLYYMGICSLQTKDKAQARDALTRALSSGLQDPLATEAKRTLQDISRN